MNWFKKIVPPGFKKIFTKRSSSKDLWLKCNNCEAMIFHKDAEENLYVCGECDHHMRISAKERFNQLLDPGSITYIENPKVPIDPLRFKDEKKYVDRLKDSKKKTKISDSVVIGYGSMNNINVTLAVHDFQFMGGSLGMAAGEAIIKAISFSLENNYPFILCASSGGARMQEGILSLMQMPRTTIMIQALREKKAICFAADQVPQRGLGEYLKLFNREAYSTTLVQSLASKTLAPVLYFHLNSNKGNFLSKGRHGFFTERLDLL